MISLLILTVVYLAWSVWAMSKIIKHIRNAKNYPPMRRHWYWLELPHGAYMWYVGTGALIIMFLVGSAAKYLQNS